MRKGMLILFTLFCILVLCSCENEAVTEQPPKEETKEQEVEIQKPSLVFEDSWGRNTPKFNGILYDVQEYQLVSDGNKYFLRYNIYTPKPFILYGYWGPFSFESNNELQKYLYDEERGAKDRKEIQWHFYLDERKYVPLLNIEKEYYPTVPEGITCDGSIVWWGSSIKFTAENPVSGNRYYITVFEDDMFYEIYENPTSEWDNDEWYTFLKEEWDKERNSIDKYYMYNSSIDKYKCHVRVSMYEIIQKNKKLIIREEYRFDPIVDFEDGGDYSETIPQIIWMYGCDKGVKFMVQMYDERPSIEFLSQFGVETVDVYFQKKCNTK